MGERTGWLKALINAYKYDSVRAAAFELAEMLDVRLDDEKGVIVPLPTINRHIRERGFDHIELVAQKMRLPYVKALRRANKAVQVGASAEKRREQAASAYVLNGRINPALHYLLLDDVWTTGSSMLAACKTLRDAGVQKISVVVIAKTVD